MLLENGEVGLDLRTVCGYWLYEACTGNAQAYQLARSLIDKAHPSFDSATLLQRCGQGELAAIEQAIALMHAQLHEQFEQAFDQSAKPPDDAH